MTILFSKAHNKHWFRQHYCFKCKKVTRHLRCGDCDHFMCYECSDIAEPETCEGSVIDKGGYPVHVCYK